MARSDYEGAPQVQADTGAPDDYEHVQTNQDQAGGALVRGITSAATDFNNLYTKTATDDATNQLQQYSNTILNGNPGQQTTGPDGQPSYDTGFLGKRGADAMHAAPHVLSDLDEKIQEIREGLPTREAQLEFDTESRKYRFNWQAQVSSHAREQQYVWAKSVNSVSEQTALNKIGSSPEDSDQFLQGVMSLRKAYKSQAALDGLDPSEAEMRADQNATLTRIRALMPTNAPMAQQVFDANTKILGGLPNYDAIANQVKIGVAHAEVSPAINETVAGAQAAAQSMVGSTALAKPGFDSAWQFTLSHEGGYSAHDANGQPVNFGINQGAHPGVDVSKLTPATAKPLAKPYWDQIHGDSLPVNMQGPAFDTAFIFGPKVANEMIAQAGGDPNKLIDIRAQRMQQLINKEPEKFDKFRGAWEKRNNDLRAQVGAGSGGQTYPSTADAINANYATTMQHAQEYAQNKWPQYPDLQEQYLTGVERNLQRTVAQQERMHEVNTHIVQTAMLGPHAPTSEAELTSSSPQVAAAWHDMQFNAPGAARNIENVFDANAQGKADGFGQQFNSMLMDRVLAPANDPHRIKGPSDIWPYVAPGKDAPITNSGLGALSGILQQRGTPQGEAQAAQLRSFFQKARKALSDQDPASGISDPEGEQRFTHFVMNALPNIKAEQDAGKPLSAILGEKGDIAASIGIYDRPLGKRMHDVIHGRGTANVSDQSPQAQQAAMAAGFQKSYASAQNDQQRQEVIEDARRNGFIFRPKQAPQQPNPNAPPEVPRPSQLEQLQRGSGSKPITKETLDTPQQQWGKLQIDDYDYGKLKDTNPLAYLGYMASRGKVSEYKTPLNALGITAEDKGYDKDKGDEANLVRKVMTEAGVDPKSATGHILLGPEFAAGKNTYTLEHELMHRGLMALFEQGKTNLQNAPSGELDGRLAANLGYHNQEPLLQLWTLLHGTGGHQNNLAKQPSEYMKDYPSLVKNQKFYDEQLQAIQALAKRAVGK